MSFLQVVLAEDTSVSSGSEIRNNANLMGLSTVAECSRCLLTRSSRHNERHSHLGPTVLALEPASVEIMIATVRRTEPDLVLFEGVQLLEAMVALRGEFPELPIIIDFHNIESSLDRQIVEARYPRVLRSLVRTFSLSRQQKARSADLLAGSVASIVWTCSALDKQTACDLGIKQPIDIIPNPIPNWVSESDCSARGNDVLFVGHLGYPPNKRAVRELCRSIMPRLASNGVQSQLHVCGRKPGRRISRLVQESGHKLTPNPVTLTTAYKNARVAVMPLRDGGGTRIKAIEALAVGCPVVATSKAVEGLGLVPELHYLVAETPQDFVTALTRVFLDDDLVGRLRHTGRRFAEKFGEGPRRRAIEDSVSRLLHKR